MTAFRNLDAPCRSGLDLNLRDPHRSISPECQVQLDPVE
jgi:hypothetical protein